MNTDTKPIYTWDAKPSRRNLTAADIRACKGLRKLTQTTANTVEEAAAPAGCRVARDRLSKSRTVKERHLQSMLYLTALKMRREGVMAERQVLLDAPVCLTEPD